MKRIYLEISVIYAAFLASLSLYYGIMEILNSFGHLPYLFLLTLLTLFPGVFWKNFEKKGYVMVALILLTLAALLLSLHFSGTKDIMGGFSLILVSSLLFYSLHDTLRELYSGLSFYIVGLFLLLAIGVLQLLILAAEILDYYILCIGESCTPYSFSLRPEYLLFFLGLFALYPFFHRWEFRRKER